ncbi:MAG TPA: nitronate monooxygenase, partial [Solirubrobacter sp.]|nr:nitronate monooxygenase [Solirubrobacter sp.]
PELRPLLEATLAAVSVPVIAAGGLATTDDVARVMRDGAAGVRIGTRFIAAAESEAHPAWIAAVLDADADESVVTHAFNAGMPVPGPHRVLRRSIEAARALTGETEFPPTPPSRDATGDVDAMPFYAGRSVGAVSAVQPAAAIVAELGHATQ